MNPSCTRHAASVCTGLINAASLNACGSEESGTQTEGGGVVTTVSTDTFVDKGNALCAANTEAIRSVFGQMSQPPTTAELTAAFDNLVKESTKIGGDLLAVGAPQGREAEFIDLILGMHQVVTSVDDQGREVLFATEEGPFAAMADTLVNEFGLTSCGSSE